MSADNPNVEHPVFDISLNLQTEGCSAWGRASNEPSNYVRTLGFSVIGYPQADPNSDEPEVVGVLSADEVLVTQALNNDISLFEVCDSTSQDLHDVFCLTHDVETEQVSHEFLLELGPDHINMDWLYVPSDEVLDYSWGPEAMRVLLENAARYRWVVVGVSGLTGPVEAQEHRKALERAAVLRNMGFNQLDDTPFFFINMAYTLPKFPAELTSKERSRRKISETA